MTLCLTPFDSSIELDLVDLFRSFPYKAYQQRFQGMDAGALAEFFAASEMTFASEQPERTRCLVENDALTGYVAVRDDVWHSGVYECTFMKLQPFVTHRASPEGRRALLNAALEIVREAGGQHLVCRIDGAEFDALRLLCDAGLYLVDVSVKMAARIENVPTLKSVNDLGARMRPFADEDLPEIRRLAVEGHAFNHYYNDPHLPAEKTALLFEKWVERCASGGLAKAVWVLEVDGRVAGFAVYLDPVRLNERLGTRMIVLDFVVLDDSVRGRGLGGAFISESLHAMRGYNMVELRTSEHNLPAQACYVRLGMQVIGCDFVLHGSV